MANSRVYTSNFPLPVAASTTIAAEDHVMYDASGDLVVAADTASCIYAGQAVQEATNTGTAGSVTCKVKTPEGEYHRMTASGATKAWHGQLVFSLGGNTVGLAAAATNDVAIGRCIYCESATSVIVNTADRFALPTAS